MIVQYTSDIHLEFRSIEQIPKLLKNIGADVLILAGDICAVGDETDFSKFIALLKYYCPKYKYVIMCTGNHEYYLNSSITPGKANCMDAVNRRLKSLTKIFTNYLYLNCDTVTLTVNKKQYMFIGASLWSKVNIRNREEVQSRMNDYEHIYLFKDNQCCKFTVADMQRLHSKHALFIKKAVEIANELKIPCVLITHHKPVGDTPEAAKTPLTQAYETDMSSIILAPIKVAIFGHTHQHYCKIINNIKYISNPVGYPGQHTKFKPDLGVEIK